jgi:hypothetical protein
LNKCEFLAKLVLLSLLLGLAACGNAQQEGDIPQVAATVSEIQGSSVPIVEIAVPGLERLDEVIANIMEKYGVPGGAYAMARG